MNRVIFSFRFKPVTDWCRGIWNRVATAEVVVGEATNQSEEKRVVTMPANDKQEIQAEMVKLKAEATAELKAGEIIAKYEELASRRLTNREILPSRFYRSLSSWIKNKWGQVILPPAIITNSIKLISKEILTVKRKSKRWSKGFWSHISPTETNTLSFLERLERRFIDNGLLLSNLRQSLSNWNRSELGPVYPLVTAILIGIIVLIYGLVTDSMDATKAPTIDHIGNKSVAEGELIQFTISASDPNNDKLSYSASNLPSGANFDTETGTFSWIPTYAQAGIHTNIHFEIIDDKPTASVDITITVNQPYDDSDVNHDGDTDILDMIVVVQRQGESGPDGWIPEDVNEDGTVNTLDMIPIGQQ